MKLFQQLLVAPAAIGLFAPLSVSASEINLEAISNYSNDNLEVDANSFKQNLQKNLLLSGGEGLVESTGIFWRILRDNYSIFRCRFSCWCC